MPSVEQRDPVIDDFDRQLTDNQRQHIQLRRTPEGTYVVERAYPGPHHLDDGVCLDQQTALRHSQAAEVHFDLLRQEGITVPETTEFKIVPHRLGGVALRNTAEYIPGAGFKFYWNWMHLGPLAPHQVEAAKLADSLIRYYGRVFSEGLDTVLADAARIVQYAVAPDGRIVLHDTDPLIRDIRPGTDDCKRTILAQVMEVYTWARYIQPVEVAQVISESIDQLCAKHKLEVFLGV